MTERTGFTSGGAQARLLGILLLAGAGCAEMHPAGADAALLRDGSIAAGDGSANNDPRDGALVDATLPAATADAANGSADASVRDGAIATLPDGALAPRGPQPVLLGTAAAFALLAKSAVSSVPTSAITGDVGVSPAAASYITGFPYTRAGVRWTTPEVTGSIYAADNDAPTPSNMTTAVSNMETAYVDAAGRPTPDFSELGTGAIGGRTLVPGLYKWSSTVSVLADVVLAGGPDDVWIFQIAGGLTVAANTSMTLSGGARAQNVFWQVASPVDFGTSAHGEGTILCAAAITLQAGASVHGRLLAQTAVHVAMSSVTVPTP